MTTLTVSLPDDLANKIEQAARDDSLSVEEWTKIQLSKIVYGDEADALTVAKQLMQKDIELYQLLA